MNQLINNTKENLDDLSLSKLNEKCDLMEDEGVDEEEQLFLEKYRRMRLAAMREEANKACFGLVKEVTKADWKTEVTEAGDVYIIIHIAEKGLVSLFKLKSISKIVF